MKQRDIKTTIYNCNQKLLQINEVYNSERTDDIIKLAIRTRNLQGMAPDEFEDRYLQALYGIGQTEEEVDCTIQHVLDKLDPSKAPKNETKNLVVQEKILEPRTTTSIVKQDSSFDLVPVAIDQLTLAKSEHSESYLLRICQEHQITMRQLHIMIECKLEYHTNFDTIVSLMGKGFDLDEVQCFLEAREQLSSDDEKTENISLIQIVRFQERFEGMPIDADHLVNKIKETFEIMAALHAGAEYDYYMGTAIKNIIQVADDLDTPFLEVALKWVAGDTAVA